VTATESSGWVDVSREFVLVCDAAGRISALDGRAERILGAAAGTPLLALTCRHSADGDVVQLEHRFINLAAVPQADNESFDTIAPGRWLLDHVPWSEAEHTIRAESADARIARLMHVERGAACLVIERRTWQGRKAITLARLVHPGARHALTGRFRPAGVTGR
jgi:GntR family histidine utilization transcriptional repressor